MSGICGFVGPADPAVLGPMLDAIDYRGDRTDVAHAAGAGLGYRWWGGRPWPPCPCRCEGRARRIPRAASKWIACPPPSRPVITVSATQEARQAATTASAALPPASRISAPTSAVTGCPAATARMR